MPTNQSTRKRRRVNGDGSVYKRQQDGYWVGAFYARTTSGASPARVITSRRYSGSFEIRTVSNRCPASVIRTSTDRRRCRSIPTICLPAYCSLTRASSNRWT